MSYLLDTNIVLYQFGGVSEAAALVSRLAPSGIAISVISYMELYQSLLRSSQDSELAELLSTIPVLPFSLETARRCAGVREQLARDGKRVRQRAIDLLIAATALENDLTLVTSNRADFADIPDLQTLFFTR